MPGRRVLRRRNCAVLSSRRGRAPPSASHTADPPLRVVGARRYPPSASLPGEAMTRCYRGMNRGPLRQLPVMSHPLDHSALPSPRPAGARTSLIPKVTVPGAPARAGAAARCTRPQAQARVHPPAGAAHRAPARRRGPVHVTLGRAVPRDRGSSSLPSAQPGRRPLADRRRPARLGRAVPWPAAGKAAAGQRPVSASGRAGRPRTWPEPGPGRTVPHLPRGSARAARIWPAGRTWGGRLRASHL